MHNAVERAKLFAQLRKEAINEAIQLTKQDFDTNYLTDIEIGEDVTIRRTPNPSFHEVVGRVVGYDDIRGVCVQIPEATRRGKGIPKSNDNIYRLTFEYVDVIRYCRGCNSIQQQFWRHQDEPCSTSGLQINCESV